VLEALGTAVKITTQIALSDAQANIHNRTGMLSQSLAHGTDVEHTETSVTGIVGTSAYYADYVERGTKDEFGNTRNPPYPYLMPALNANKSTFEQLARKELETAIRKAAK
jgi:HK97 gp10 family phage protein